MNYVVVQKNRVLKTPDYITAFFAVISCYLCIIPLVLLDMFVWQFQQVYFRIFEIPIIRRTDYVCIDRYQLNGLSIMQKINCVYCGYANGLIAYVKAVVNQMEVYSCAIKHVRTPKGHAHHKDFHSRDKFK